MNGFFYKIQQFMSGRNGIDSFSGFLFVLYISAAAVNLFIRSWYVYIFELAILGYIVFRALSRNLYARSAENRFFKKCAKAVKDFFIRQRNRIRDIRTHRYIRCRYCKSWLRVPRRKGTHTVRCPRCRTEFKTTIHI